MIDEKELILAKLKNTDKQYQFDNMHKEFRELLTKQKIEFNQFFKHYILHSLTYFSSKELAKIFSEISHQYPEINQLIQINIIQNNESELETMTQFLQDVRWGDRFDLLTKIKNNQQQTKQSSPAVSNTKLRQLLNSLKDPDPRRKKKNNPKQVKLRKKN